MLKFILIIIILSIIIEHILSIKNNESTSNDSIIPIKKHKSRKHNNVNKYKNIEYDNPNPWNKIIYNPDNKYLYTFFINIDIPSFNNYHDWKKIINNIEYIPKNKELVISAPDEETAIAIINLIIMTFTNKISMDDIISKDLINISINKTKENIDIKEKFRQQINEYIYSQNNNTDTTIDDDSIKKPNAIPQQVNNKQTNIMEDINAYDGNDYSYL
jgi:hypothetical protein